MVVLLVGCGGTEQMADNAAPSEALKDEPVVLQRGVQAHGGLNKWKQFGAVEYDFSLEMGDVSRSDHHVVDLYSRDARVEGEAYTIGVTDTSAWAAPSMEAYGFHAPPRFYGKAYPYLFSVPFVFGDPGVETEAVGQRKLQGSTYNVVKVTFEQGVGDTPEDVYYVYCDPNSHRVRAALFSVTFRNPSIQRPITGVLYDWKTVDGLTVPEKGEMYAVTEDLTFKKKLGSLRYSNVDFKKTPPPASTFAMPEDAVRDRSLRVLQKKRAKAKANED
jgi:hypothetical protein